MQRYAAWMPYMSWVSLGEGGTSCTNFSSLAHELGVAAIHIKNEGQNPSGSHKDRMSCLAVTCALDVGATMIVAASSGNRSEEHTYELQSLMRNSYDVVCLIYKKTLTKQK